MNPVSDQPMPRRKAPPRDVSWVRSAEERGPTATHARLIDAANRVFVRDGIGRASTRKIAREARVNEVTLFRHFESKQRLLRAVVFHHHLETGGRKTAALVSLRSTGSLQTDLMHIGRRIQRVFSESLPLLRTFTAELYHYDPVGASQVLELAMQPWRDALILRMRSAPGGEADLGPVRSAINADLFLGMLFADAVRQALRALPAEYRPREYLAAAVGLVIQSQSRPVAT